jgi:hypothetical protein
MTVRFGLAVPFVVAFNISLHLRTAPKRFFT